MVALILADAVLVLHLAFVLFVLFGGLLALRWRPIIWAHLPAVLWGTFVEFSGWVCPLTPLENWLRTQAGISGYEGDFIARYIIPILYPEALTSDIQTILGTVVVVVNLAIYGWLLRTNHL